MVTAAESERLGVLETEVAHIKADVSEIKSDVKALVVAQQKQAVDDAAEKAAEQAIRQSRTQTGMWIRFFTERAIAILALVVALFAFLGDVIAANAK